MIETLGDIKYDDGDGVWNTEVSNLDKNSVIYSFGIGHNTVWDEAMIAKGCTVHSFDFTPDTVEWMKGKTVKNLIFHPYGLSRYTGFQTFHLRKKPQWKGAEVSVSLFPEGEKISLPVKTLRMIMKELGHDHIDVLKIDIEGAEYKILPTLRNIPIKQLLIELHAPKKIFKLQKLWALFTLWWGYKLVYRNGSDYTFLKRTFPLKTLFLQNQFTQRYWSQVSSLFVPKYSKRWTQDSPASQFIKFFMPLLYLILVLGATLFPLTAFAAITLDTSSESSATWPGASGATVSWSQTNASGDTMQIVMVYTNAAADAVSSVTDNTVSMSKITSYINKNGQSDNVYAYCLANPSSGSNAFVINLSPSERYVIGFAESLANASVNCPSIDSFQPDIITTLTTTGDATTTVVAANSWTMAIFRATTNPTASVGTIRQNPSTGTNTDFMDSNATVTAGLHHLTQTDSSNSWYTLMLSIAPYVAPPPSAPKPPPFFGLFCWDGICW